MSSARTESERLPNQIAAPARIVLRSIGEPVHRRIMDLVVMRIAIFLRGLIKGLLYHR